MKEQEIIDLIKNRLKVELDCKYGLGFVQYAIVRLLLNTGSEEEPKFECISEDKLSINKF